MAQKMSVVDLASKAEVNKATVSEIERGATNFKRDTLDRIATALGHQSGSELYRYLGGATVPDDESTIEADVTDDDVSGFKKEDIPVVAEGSASPDPNLFWDDTGVLMSEVEDRITRPYDVSDPRAYGVRVRGDSMVTRLKPGDIAIVSPNTPAADGDEVYAQLLSGERLLKVAHRIPGGWMLESYNRAYEPRMVKASEIGAMHPILWIRPKRRGTPIPVRR